MLRKVISIPSRAKIQSMCETALIDSRMRQTLKLDLQNLRWLQLCYKTKYMRMTKCAEKLKRRTVVIEAPTRNMTNRMNKVASSELYLPRGPRPTRDIIADMLQKRRTKLHIFCLSNGKVYVQPERGEDANGRRRQQFSNDWV